MKTKSATGKTRKPERNSSATHPMPITFQKMHGAGNDFVLLDLRRQVMPLDSGAAIRIANRRTGVGCDQVLVLYPPETGADLVRFEVWNADGSRAEQCGNGVRCIGRYLQARGEAPAGRFSLQGPAGHVTIECLASGQVRVDMGSPAFEPPRVPISLEPRDGWYTLDFEDGPVRFGAVSMGNPHAVVPVDDVDAIDIVDLGRRISSHPVFPRGCNVGFAQVIDPGNIRLRVFERGSGATLACGSGACAAMVVLARDGQVGARACVNQPGGLLIISWTGGNQPVSMQGPAVHVFEGTMP